MKASDAAEKNSGRVRILRDTAIVIGISVALLLVFEFFLRSFFPQTIVETAIEGQRFSVRDDVIGMRYVPGAKWRVTHPEYAVEYVINADGFRDTKEHPVPKPSGTVRALLLGDSFSFGHGSNYNDTWPVIVEKHLAMSGIHHIDLVKAGIQGMNTRSELILMRELVKKYEPDVVVVGFLINDLYDNSLYGIEHETEALEGSIDNGAKEDPAESWFRTMNHTFVRSNRYGGEFHLLNLIRRVLIANDLLYCKLYISSERGAFMSARWPSEISAKVKVTEILLKKMHEYSQWMDKKLIVLSIPQQFQVLYLRKYKKSKEVDVALYDRHFADVGKQTGFAWINTLDRFANTDHEPAKLFYRWDGHLTPAGNRIVAEVFMREIVPLLNHQSREPTAFSGRWTHPQAAVYRENT